MNKELNDPKLRSLKRQMELVLMLLDQIDSSIDKLGLTNKQFVLNFYDELNRISVKK